MQENALHFYHSKVKLFIQLIFFLPFMVGGFWLIYEGIIDQVYMVVPIALLFVALFGILCGVAFLKLLRNHPYITIKDSYIVLDPKTKSEIIIYYDHIESIQVSEASFQKIIEVVIYDEHGYADKLSFFNKMRLKSNGVFGFKTFTLAYQAIRKRDRTELLTALDNIMAYKEAQSNEGEVDPVVVTDIDTQTVESQKEFMEKYDPRPIGPFVTDKRYFKRAYGYSLFQFTFMLILFYFLLDSGKFYLYYIIVSFFLFPFAKLFIDWMGVYKLRERLEKQKGPTYYFDQMKYFLDGILFHLSLYLAPLGLIVFIIRSIVKKRKEKKTKEGGGR